MLESKKRLSRESLGKLLLKLPNVIFPSYRCPMADDHHHVASQTEDIFRVRKCKNCHRRNSSAESLLSDSSDRTIPPPPALPPLLVAPEPHLGSIRPEDLASVKLRTLNKDNDYKSAKSSSAEDMTRVLKRRYRAMHTLTPQKKEEFCSEDEEVMLLD